jgi:hypothetical protein
VLLVVDVTLRETTLSLETVPPEDGPQTLTADEGIKSNNTSVQASHDRAE